MSDFKNEPEQTWAEKNVPTIFGVGTFVMLGMIGVFINLCS